MFWVGLIIGGILGGSIAVGVLCFCAVADDDELIFYDDDGGGDKSG